MMNDVPVRAGTWRSELLERDASFVLHGRTGPVVIALPTGAGGVDEWVEQGAIAVLHPSLAAGRIRVCRVAFEALDPWQAPGLDASERTRRCALLERAILDELAPRLADGAPLILAGAELGGFHAISTALTRPDAVLAVLALDPWLDPAALLGDGAPAEAHALDPARRVMLEDDPARLARLCDVQIMIAIGALDTDERSAAERLIGALEARGIEASLRIWDSGTSGWPGWLPRLEAYLGGEEWPASSKGRWPASTSPHMEEP